MSEPARYFPYLKSPINVLLRVPFHRGTQAIGTVWVASHETDRLFDREDAQVMTALSQFAAAAIERERMEKATRRELKDTRCCAMLPRA